LVILLKISDEQEAMEETKPFLERRHPVKRPFWSISPLYVKVILISFIILSFGMYYAFFLLEDRLENFPYNYHSMVYPGFKYKLKPFTAKQEQVNDTSEKAETLRPQRTSLLENKVEKALYRFEKNRVLLLNFTDLEINRRDNNSGEVSGYGGIADVEVIADRHQPDGFLRISYKVSLPESFCGFSGKLKGIPLSKYSKLAFDLKGETGNEVFRLVLGNKKEENKLSITSILPNGFSSEWQRVTVPIAEFGKLASSNNFEGYLTFLFENSQGTPYDGEVCFKEIAFEK
jgi:hypothetical protein